MLNFRRISLFHRSISIKINACRFRSNRRSSKSLLTNEKHIITETKPVSLDNLSPVVRQILSKDPSYAVRFGGQLSENKKYLVRQHSRTTGRAENLLSQIPKDDIILSINEDEDDLPHPPIVAFPSVENHFQMNLGTEDTTIPIHETAHCFGCGASLQCADKTKPGFVPVEIYKHYLSTNLQKRTSQCQRCFLFKYTNEISHCEVNEQVYKDILTEIKRKRALIILIVDLLDIPNSISRLWAHLIDETAKNHHTSSNIIFVLGNKVDLLPKGKFDEESIQTNNKFILDNETYLSNVRQCLENECTKRGLGKHIVKYYGLISARTGYGIEELISKVFRYWSQHGGAYLLGGTNAGKSSLFNSLIDSDLCHIHALDCIQPATVSNLPGTTMNVVRFPIQLRTGKNQFMREERLKEREENETIPDDDDDNSIENETTAAENVESTVKWRRRFESEMNLPKSGASYTYSSGENSFNEDRSFESSEHNYINYRQKKMRAFNPGSYKNEKWLFDTPGVILPEQMINKCSNQTELSFFDHQSTAIRPVNILLDVGQTILIGGVARIDVKHITNHGQATISLMTTSRLPINVIQTKDVEKFYENALEKNQLGVPQNRINGRLQDPPRLIGPTIEILGIGEEEAAGDIVLSSAGWASVQCSRDQYVVFDVMTPDGLGIHLRQPPLLKYLIHLRGSQIEQTPFFNKHIYKEDQQENEDNNEYQSNELEMIINEKLWKGEQNKHRRRTEHKK
ncbi:unnamed protein product [Rotaria sordida]|uniref:G domain-containing protein n=1 Tax=Rotaria sordida TaxID=392033 RepID=A0A814YF57_9BILA|nr:unnamed protein product [Rotaria sordida]CAF1228610.1 unnamed protein product [Rotaria sordida]